MISLVAYILIALMGVVIMPRWSVFPYEIPRQTFISVGGILLMTASIMAGSNVIAGYLYLLAPMLIWWVLATIFSRRPDISLETMIPFFFCMIVGLLASRDPANQTGLSLIVLSGTVNAIYAILRKHFRVNIFKRMDKNTPLAASGFMGNTNFFGPWQVLTIFFTIKLGTTAIWGPVGFLLCVLIQMYAVMISRCRAAYLGLTAGCLYLAATGRIEIMGLLGMFIFSIALAARTKVLTNIMSTVSLRSRRAFYRIFWEAFKRRPVFGYGFNMVKCMVPYLQRDINHRTGGEFLKPDNFANPVIRKAHNDLLQHILDVGLLGAAITVCNLFFGIRNPAPGAMSVIIAFVVMGLFFHQAYGLPTQCFFWLAWGSMAEPASFSLGQQGSILLIVILALGLLATVLKTQIFDVYHYLGSWSEEGKVREAYMRKASGIRTNSLQLFTAANEIAKSGDIPQSMTWLHRAMDRYDGDCRIWMILACMAEGYLHDGSLSLAKYYHEEALTFYPEFDFSKSRLEWMKKIKIKKEKPATG